MQLQEEKDFATVVGRRVVTVCLDDRRMHKPSREGPWSAALFHNSWALAAEIVMYVWKCNVIIYAQISNQAVLLFC